MYIFTFIFICIYLFIYIYIYIKRPIWHCVGEGSEWAIPMIGCRGFGAGAGGAGSEGSS